MTTSDPTRPPASDTLAGDPTPPAANAVDTTPGTPSPAVDAPADAAAPKDAVPADAPAADAPSAEDTPTDAVPAPAVDAPAGAAPETAPAADAVPADATASDANSTDPVPGDATSAPQADAPGADTARADASAVDEAPADGVPPDAVPADASSVAESTAEAGIPDPRLRLARGEEPTATAEALASDGAQAPAVPAAPVPGAGGQAAESAVRDASVPATAAVPPQAVAADAGHPATPAAPVPAAPATAAVPQPTAPGVGGYPHNGAVAPQAGAGTFWALPAQYAPKARKERPWLRTVGRWGMAVAVAVVVGSVTAALVAAPARTDLPGLRTPSDGRWTFPSPSLPALPPGDSQVVTEADAQHVHRVDLRSLLLSAPVGATADSALPGTRGWYAESSLLGLFPAAPSGQIKAALQDAGLRHVAAIGWTMPDGTRTQIYLQQFRSASTTSDADVAESVGGFLAAAGSDAGSAGNIQLGDMPSANVRSAPAINGHPAVTYGYAPIGDTELLVVMTNPKRVPAVDFEQVMELQNRLLSA